jgi:hypothetical protein
MQPFEKMQLQCGVPLAIAANPADGKGLRIWHHREEETAGARLTGYPHFCFQKYDGGNTAYFPVFFQMPSVTR